jgi:hypothetical protein
MELSGVSVPQTRTQVKEKPEGYGEEWSTHGIYRGRLPLFAAVDEPLVSCPLGDSHGARCQNLVTVGGGRRMGTRSSLRCAMSQVHDQRSSAGEMGDVAAVRRVR